jgi:hypothetical protein
MRTMPHTITPRTPLTLTELETLAVMLDNATQHMGTTRDTTGHYAWGPAREYSDAMNEMFTGFYDIRENTALMVCGPAMPWDTAEGQVTITAHA